MPWTEGVPAVLREQMIDIAVFKLKPVAGVKTDEWDEDGELELSKKMEVVKTFERVLVNGEAVQKNVVELTEKPEAVLLNFNNMGYAQVRFDDESRKVFLANVKYITNAPARTYVWRILAEMMHCGDLGVGEWFQLVKDCVEFETEEQTLAIVLDEILHTWKYGLLDQDQMLEIFSKISRLEMTVVDEALVSKAALINQFCSEIVVSGLVIEPSQMGPEDCYEVIGFQAKSKVQVYTFLKLLFANPNVDTDTKMRFMRGLQKLDEQGIKDLDDILDRQGGFT